MVRTSARPVERFGLCNLAHGRGEEEQKNRNEVKLGKAK
jgi:hypothetical protein